MTQLAVQLYTLRSLLDGSLKSFETVIASIAEKGFQAVETAGLPDANVKDIRAVLDTYGISVCSAHIAMVTLEADFKNQVKTHQALANNNLVIPFLQPNMRGSNAEEWKVVAKRIGHVANACDKAGMQLHYHNHEFEMVSFENKTALEIIAAEAGENLNIELDLAWVVRGEQDPSKLLEHFSGRVTRVHVKDIAPDGKNLDEDGWADVGHGIMDWKHLLPKATMVGAEAFIVEHDNPKDPEKTISRGIEFIKSIQS